MSTSEVRLSIVATTRSAELVLVDAGRSEIARGVGSVEALVPPGFYKVRQRIGDREGSELVEVVEGPSRALALPELL